jgi:hypothetical protein
MPACPEREPDPSMGEQPGDALLGLEDRWRRRRAEWARKLGRLRLGAEPIEEQLARYRRVTIGLAIVPGVMSLIFLSLFSVFGRPDIGVLIVLLFFGPIALFSWLGYRGLARKAAAFRDEEARFEAERARLGPPTPETGSVQPAG